MYLTFDVEPFWTTLPVRHPRSAWDSYEDDSFDKAMKFLDFCDEYNLKATFFIVSEWSRRNPKFIQEAALRGHHLGSHSRWHEDVSLMSDEEFLSDISYSKKFLEDQCGLEINAFRAPSFSIKLRQLDLVSQAGFDIDSSVSSAARLYGGSQDPAGYQTEIALTCIPFIGARILGKEFTFLGGGYLRLLPIPILKFLIGNIDLGNMIYLHPHDLTNDIKYYDHFTRSDFIRRKLIIGNTLQKLAIISETVELASLCDG